ncbi:MAG: MerR family transcriptional regulator [Acidimicrobiales bacterium]|nr:MerR family transcriptional regulator [Acidimicrobiales bacterium]
MTNPEHDETAQARLTMAQLLDACGHAVNARTVRYWIREGLLDAPSGGRGVHARYGPSHTERILEIRRLQELGLSLANIGLLLRAPQPAPSAPDVADAPFWRQPPRQREQPVPLAAGVRLLLDRSLYPTLDDDAVEALRRAAGPLLTLLSSLPQASTSARPSPLLAPAADRGGAGDER